MTQKELAKLNKLDSLAGKLVDRNFEEEKEDYGHFIKNAYGTPVVLKSLAKTTLDFADREKKRKGEVLDFYNNALKWVVSDLDSIPLFTSVDGSSRYKPLIIVEEKYTAGFQFADSLANGYFRTITPSRRADVAVGFPVDKNFTLRKLPVIKALSAADENGQVFYTLFYSEEKVEDKFPVTLAKIYRTDGLAWSNNFSFELLPAEVSFQIESGEIAVKTSNPAGESKMVYIDKNGKRIDPPKP